ncbi:hypothetical protein [Pseudoalteromonas denitrificans]|uniref:Uncharacterized protein n=1 Tax=Pseudoalteromonas denitrificans DSM 6059 TaxID=1123010 RepID=A0A1I1RYD8_9GAMM|nr:hypothetical protein [Pseudoalteromonas denitrificans]SFD37288.1 hypothetical protein SAMN02745724_04330 [Pseudoalteromonas denitrificans DSM 6059]
MKLKLNKKKIKNLSQDKQSLPAAMTPQIAGGVDTNKSWFGHSECRCKDTFQ